MPPDFDLYVRQMGLPGHAIAQSRWYRTFQIRERPRWLRGQYADADVDVPVRWLHGMDNPVITPKRQSLIAVRVDAQLS